MTSETTIGTDESTIMTFSPADYRDRVLIADGDYQLEAVLRGWPRGTATAEMSLSRPDIATAVAGAFLDAGSDLLVTPTSTANLLARDVALAGEQAGFEKFAELNRRWARLCRDAVSQSQAAKRWVLGAVGPPARLLLLREIERGQVIEAYEQQIAALRDGGVDGIVCRGFTELDALVMAVEAAEAFGLPIIGCMAFDGGPSRTETTLGVTAMQVDPNSPDTVYAGTLNGIYKTTDAAQSWKRIAESLPDQMISAMLLDRSAANVLYAASRQGIYKSEDGGTTWRALNKGLTSLNVRSLAQSWLDPSVWYVGTNGSGLYRSEDRGETWVPMPPVKPAG